MELIEDIPQAGHSPAIWPTGRGETASLIRSLDWSKNHLGPTGAWPQSLRSVVDLVLACEFPMVILWGPHLIQIYNDGYLALMGDKHPSGMGQPTQQCWPEVWHINEPVYNRVLLGETITYNDQLFPITRHGFLEEAFFTLCYSPARDEAGKIAGILVTVFETTAQIQASRARDRSNLSLRQSEERLHAAQEAGHLASWDWDLITGQFIWSGTVELVYGQVSNELATIDQVMQSLHPGDRERVMTNVSRSIASKQPFDHEFRIICTDASINWVAGKGKATYSPEGVPLRMVGVNWNITARKHSDEALQASEQRFRLALAAANGVGIWDWDVENDVFYADSTMARVYGVDPIWASTGAPIAEYIKNIHPEDRTYIEIAVERTLRTGGDYSQEYRINQADGSIRWVSASGGCSLKPDGTPLRFTGLTIDISDRKLTEAALQMADKLAAVGRLASSIAHEINNPLEAITNLFYLMQTTPDRDEWPGFLALAQDELRRVSEIATQTLRFHRQASKPKPVNLAEMFRSVLILYKTRMENEDMTVESRLHGNINPCCYEGDVRQVIHNLVGNAYDAMRRSDIRHLSIRSHGSNSWKTGHRGVRVTVADTGCGMSAATVANLFEPFFTTKGINGTGLGLWVSLGIMQKHHGTLVVRSSQKPGRTGTVFSMFIPDLTSAEVTS